MANNVTVSQVEVDKSGKTPRIILHYTSEKSKGEVWKISALAVNLDETSRAKLKSVSAGDPVSIKMKKEGTYWNLVGVGDPVSETYSNNSSKTKSYDDTGVKVGAARNQAIAFLAATKGKSFTLDDVDAAAYEIVTRQAKMEANIRNKVNPHESNVEQETQFAQANVPEIGDW